MQRGTLLTVRESGDGSSRDDAGLAPKVFDVRHRATYRPE